MDLTKGAKDREIHLGASRQGSTSIVRGSA